MGKLQWIDKSVKVKIQLLYIKAFSLFHLQKFRLVELDDHD